MKNDSPTGSKTTQWSSNNDEIEVNTSKTMLEQTATIESKATSIITMMATGDAAPPMRRDSIGLQDSSNNERGHLNNINAINSKNWLFFFNFRISNQSFVDLSYQIRYDYIDICLV